MNNNFDNWNILKKKINNFNRINHPKIREIWWINLGLNIGTEIYGKNVFFTRPVLVIKNNLNSFLGIPLYSKIRKNKNRITIKTIDGKFHSVLLEQVKMFDNKRLINRKYIISNNKFKKIIRRFKNMITTDC